MMPVSPSGQSPSRAGHHTQLLAVLLKRHSAFARLAPSVEQITTLATDLSGLLPAYLAPNIFSGPIRKGVLTVFAAHGALAARLRHLEPKLIQDLQRRGWAIHALKIRIHSHMPIAQPAPKIARLSPAGRCCLSALHQQLQPSPLRGALARLLEHHRNTCEVESPLLSPIHSA